jgi:hypothetical protein
MSPCACLLNGPRILSINVWVRAASLPLLSMQCACAGNPGRPLTTSWSSLPDDVVEVILSNLSTLSLLKLARIGRTCTSFQTLYRRQLAAVHEARTALADKSFGQKRMERIGDFIIHFLKGEALGPDSVEHETNMYRISADGAVSDVRRAGHVTEEADDVFVSTDITYPFFRTHHNLDTLLVHYGRNISRLLMQIRRTGRGPLIDIFPENDGDLEGVALAQTLLSGGVAKCICDLGQCADLSLHPATNGATQAGLKFQIATLIPFSSRYTRVGPMSKNSCRFTEKMQIGGKRRPITNMQTGWMGFFADKGTAQGLGNTVVQESATEALEPIYWEAWMI